MSIVVEFESGLGNQLFQFAAGRELAIKHGTDLMADSSAYSAGQKKGNRVKWRPFILKELNFPMEYIEPPSARLWGIRGFPRLYRWWTRRGFQLYRDPGEHTSEWDRLSDHARIAGYFQDLKYLPSDRTDVCHVINNRLKKVAQARNIDPIPHGWGVAHVRLGDYLSTPEFYPDWFQKYTPSVVQYLLKEHRCKKVLIFSDQPDKAREMLAEFGDKVAFAESDFALEGALDLYRMSTATVLAIANSSFSWWAAMLGSLTGTRVIAPVYWSEWCQEPQRLLYPSAWDVYGDNIENDDSEDDEK